MLQLFVVELERENAALRRENKTLRARTDILLDAMVNFCHITISRTFCVTRFLVDYFSTALSQGIEEIRHF